MVCLDTSVLIALLRKDAKAMASLRAAASAGKRVSTTAVNLCELYSGAYGSRDVPAELRKVTELTSLLELLPLDEGSARRYGELVNHRTLREGPIGDFDLVIASIALQSSDSVATRDVARFSRVPGLVVEKW